MDSEQEQRVSERHQKFEEFLKSLHEMSDEELRHAKTPHCGIKMFPDPVIMEMSRRGMIKGGIL